MTGAACRFNEFLELSNFGILGLVLINFSCSTNYLVFLVLMFSSPVNYFDALDYFAIFCNYLCRLGVVCIQLCNFLGPCLRLLHLCQCFLLLYFLSWNIFRASCTPFVRFGLRFALCKSSAPLRSFWTKLTNIFIELWLLVRVHFTWLICWKPASKVFTKNKIIPWKFDESKGSYYIRSYYADQLPANILPFFHLSNHKRLKLIKPTFNF